MHINPEMDLMKNSGVEVESKEAYQGKMGKILMIKEIVNAVVYNF